MFDFKGEEMSITIYGEVKQRIEFYRENKENNIFDDFYHSHLNYMLKCMEFYEKSKQHKYKVIMLCGSTKFKDEFIVAQRNLTLEGNVVISVGLFGHSGDAITDVQKIMLDDMHKRKIDMADEIYVINKDGYIGDSTRSEIEYAKSKNIRITYMCPIEARF